VKTASKAAAAPRAAATARVVAANRLEQIAVGAALQILPGRIAVHQERCVARNIGRHQESRQSIISRYNRGISTDNRPDRDAIEFCNFAAIRLWIEYDLDLLFVRYCCFDHNFVFCFLLSLPKGQVESDSAWFLNRNIVYGQD